MGAVETLRDALYGNPPSPTTEPSREGVLAAFEETARSINSIVGGILVTDTVAVYASLSTLNGHLEFADRTLGVVYADSDPDNIGIYIKNGAPSTGSWTFTGLLGRGPGPSDEQIALAFATYVDQIEIDVETASQAALAAAASAANAEAVAGPNYASTASGIAATTNGQTFAVDNGDGTVTIYLNNAGVAVAQRKLATTDHLASSGGADAIGAVGGTVQDLLTTLETNTKVDDTHNRVRVGANVGAQHITGGGRTQGGANLDGSLFVAEGADIATGANNDATASNAFGSAIWNFTGAKIYGCDAFGFRAQSVLEDGLYFSTFAIDAGKDVKYARNSNIVAVKGGLYVEDIRSSTLLSVLAGAGGGALENCLIGGLNACDYYGSTSRATLKNVVVFGTNAGRGMEGDLNAVVIGGSSVQALSVTGTHFVTIGSSAGQSRTTSSFSVELGYGAGSTITTENYVTSIGALADGKFANSTALGANAVCSGINEIRLGDASITSVRTAGDLYIGANKVVGARGAAVADATDAATAVTQLNALLARMRAHGLIAT